MRNNELKNLSDNFLDRWNINDIKSMTLIEYVGIGNKDTFCQWVETKTKILGSIKGMTSIKFGIYERKKSTKKPKYYENGDKYSWLRGYGNNEKNAFENIKKDIIRIIKFSENGEFEKIDKIILPNLFKWKVAFLYSNERLIPIYNQNVLFKIAKHFGLEKNSKKEIYKIQALMIENKPSNKNVYEYMSELYGKFGKEKKIVVSPSKRMKRKGTNNLNLRSHTRRIDKPYIVEQKHNKIQEALREYLVKKYGEKNVILEENYVDVKLLQEEYVGFYEVKSYSYACECIREALGQILHYAYHDEDKRKKKIFVVGQYPPTKQDYGYIKYIKEKINLDFEYLNFAVE